MLIYQLDFCYHVYLRSQFSVRVRVHIVFFFLNTSVFFSCYQCHRQHFSQKISELFRQALVLSLWLLFLKTNHTVAPIQETNHAVTPFQETNHMVAFFFKKPIIRSILFRNPIIRSGSFQETNHTVASFQETNHTVAPFQAAKSYDDYW